MEWRDALNIDEIKELSKLSNFRGFLAVITTWGLIVGSFALVINYPHVLTVFVALIILGGRHLALAILMHDCSHDSLFKTKWLNDFVGKWLCAYPTWQDLRRYRAHHLKHHKYAGTEKDPDLDLVKAYPTTKASLLRKFARDLSGITGFKRIYGLLLMDFGFIEYTVSGSVKKISQRGRSLWNIIKTGIQNLHGVVITNGVLFGLLYVIGQPEIYLLWVGSYLTTFSLILRVRSIAEHACTQMDLDPIKNTRTTIAHWWDRVTFAPHRVNYHLEHHLYMTVPYFNLPRMHQMLHERGALEGSYVGKSYAEVLRAVVK